MAGGLRGLMSNFNLSAPAEEEAYDGYYDEYEDAPEYEDASGSVIEMPTATAPAADLSRIVTVRPMKYADAEMLAMSDSLRENVPVIAHIGNMSEQDQRAFLYFMTGVAYALDAHTEHVAAHVFLISPREVSVVDGHGHVISRNEH
ncbi:hypothetical protein BSR29_03795 [Boudabousia liubingyangii]|uniref:Cell division protein SepF n=1 Tax=Boudabousia liubingyangii TaxID=1921764 RepID=A0A1Q5PN75_9ACTO|nr:cell division protein SepF [Boudabousia liubingyangii]OKL47549.1 hypothetical protein BSR28_03365 [Boudabousia liubingyangii]OKL48973.1 hypothetical protein BSR29_03795 [Boudabousia liubingyangii]